MSIRDTNKDFFKYLRNRENGLDKGHENLRFCRDYPRVMSSMSRIFELKGHSGCVNTLSWSQDGAYLLSGSDDTHLNIYNYDKNFKLISHIPSGHTHNIFNAKFLPGSSYSKIVSCACDFSVFYTEVNFPPDYGKYKFNCHASVPYDVIVTNDEPFSFFVCSHEGTVRHYDLREKTSCNCDRCSKDVIIKLSPPIHAMDLCPTRSYELALGVGNNSIQFFDRRMIQLSNARSNNSSSGIMFQYQRPNHPSSFNGVTSIGYSDDGSELIVSYVGDQVVIISCDPNDKMSTTFDQKVSPEYFSRTSYFDVDNLFPSEKKTPTIVSSTSDEQAPAPPPLGGSVSIRRKRERPIYNSSSQEYCQTSRTTEPLSRTSAGHKSRNTTHNFEPKYKQTFKGHSNTRTMLKEATFWGKRYVLSGSDCGRVFIWDRTLSTVCQTLVGDNHVVNVLQPHPILPILGCSGIDSTIKIFGPSVFSPPRKDNIESALRDNTDRLEREEQMFGLNFIDAALSGFMIPIDFEIFQEYIQEASDNSEND